MRKWFTEWQKLNPILADGEVGEIIGMLITKTGDGKTPWRALSYTPSPTVDSDPFDVTLTDAEADATSKVEAAKAYAVQRSNHTGVQTSSTISDFIEAVQDAVALLLGAGTNITVNYDDVANTLTIATTAADAEAVRDAIGVALVGVGNISIGVNDALDTITISTTATVNATDVALRDRSTHSGTQLAATISDFNSAAVLATKGAYAPLPHVAATVSADGAAVVNKHNPVDATGAARTITLPTGQTEGTALSVEKVDSSTNTVTLSGSIRGAGSTTIALAWFHETLTLVSDSTGSWWPVSGHKTKTALDAAYAGKATTSTGGVASTGDGFPVIFQTPGGGNWHLDTQTASESSTDHLFRRVYNYDMVNAATNKRRVDDVAIREAFESNYLGSFEWDLDLTAASGDLNLSAPFRPWYYTYQWASGASRLAFTGQILAQSNRDEASILVAPNSDTQTAPAFGVTKADKTTYFFRVSPGSGVIVEPTAVGKSAMVVQALSGQTAVVWKVQFSNSVVMAQVDQTGAFQTNFGYLAVANAANVSPLRTLGKASQTADMAQFMDNNASALFAIDKGGLPKWSANTNTQTTVGAAGAASALPATPTRYMQVRNYDGTLLVVPAYAAS